MNTNRAVLKERRHQVAAPAHDGDLEVIRVDVRLRTAIFQVKNTSYKETVPLSMIRPLTHEDSSTFWNMLVEDLMQVLKEEGKLPEFIKGYETKADEDSTGDPALYLTILVSPEQRYSQATVSQWNQFSNLLLDRLTALRLQRYPYVRIGEKRRRK